MARTPFAGLLDQLKRQAISELESAAGTESLCAIAKSGRPVPAVKYFEGRVAMFGELGRVAGPDGVDDVALAKIGERWERLGGLAAQSPDWSAYLQGGRDALTDLGLAATGTVESP